MSKVADREPTARSLIECAKELQAENEALMAENVSVAERNLEVTAENEALRGVLESIEQGLRPTHKDLIDSRYVLEGVLAHIRLALHPTGQEEG